MVGECDNAMEYELATLRDQLAGHAVEIGEAFGRRLDYSIKSVKQVEKILGEIHREYSRTKDDSGLSGIAIEFGAYLIKVLEQHFGTGTWERHHPEIGSDTFPYYWEGRTLFPYSWCEKRIFDGPGDNVWVKFNALVVKEASKP